MLAMVLASAGLLVLYWRGRSKILRRNTEVFWFSSLHFFSKEISECRDPQQMADYALNPDEAKGDLAGETPLRLSAQDSRYAIDTMRK